MDPGSVLVAVGSDWFGSEPNVQSEAGKPPPLTDEMLQTMEKWGTTVVVDSDATNEAPDEAQAAAEAAVAAFNFLDAENVLGVSFGSVSVEQREKLEGRGMWVVFLDDVRQPLLGGDSSQENGPGQMLVLVDPETMKFVYAKSF